MTDAAPVNQSNGGGNQVPYPTGLRKSAVHHLSSGFRPCDCGLKLGLRVPQMFWLTQTSRQKRSPRFRIQNRATKSPTVNTTPAGTHFLAYLHADQSEIMDRNTRAYQQTVEMLNETRATPA
ncbi:hypothetical protein Pan14r_52240 [Crateriforma conspicua]|uniref:Uncharacterized protein n=1 Tax=Crateriforma conspicua TaxID=2527996 RepID=A0A5C5XUH8_9PLAN|nr:hypothetical protein Pan14r_52240 [Crateriforma conspicua]